MAAAESNKLKRAACRCGPTPERCIPDNEILTQHAWRAGKFRNQPRIEREVEVSLLRGVWSIEDATRYVLNGEAPTKRQLERAVVRLTTARKLRDAGFAVVHTSGRVKEGPHVSVVWPDDDLLESPEVPWPAEISTMFDLCFNVQGR